MSKKKITTSANFERKCHRNGIKKPKRSAYASTTGVSRKYLKNLRYVRAKDPNQCHKPAPKII